MSRDSPGATGRACGTRRDGCEKDGDEPMSAQESSPRSLKELIRTGGGLDGFAWPDNVVDFDIRIARDGTWYYRDSPIRRERLVRLFATVLQRDAEGGYWLVTPGERGRVEVEDAPFLAVELDAESAPGTLCFRTNLDYWVTADAAHPIRVEETPETGEPAPYIHVRDGLEARIVRSVFYELAELAEAREIDGAPVLGVESAGTFFPLGRPE